MVVTRVGRARFRRLGGSFDGAVCDEAAGFLVGRSGAKGSANVRPAPVDSSWHPVQSLMGSSAGSTSGTDVENQAAQLVRLQASEGAGTGAPS